MQSSLFLFLINKWISEKVEKSEQRLLKYILASEMSEMFHLSLPALPVILSYKHKSKFKQILIKLDQTVWLIALLAFFGNYI